MKRRVVGKVRRSENVLQILQTEAANPRIINDVLRIIETKKVNAKNADIEEDACDRQRHKGSSVRLPRSGQEWFSDSNSISRGFSVSPRCVPVCGAEIVSGIYPPRLSFFVWLISSFQFNDLKMSRPWSQVSSGSKVMPRIQMAPKGPLESEG